MPAAPDKPANPPGNPPANPPGKAARTAAKAVRPSAASATVSPGKSPIQKALEKLGLRRDIDLALHLPLRYEDETRLSRLIDARDGDLVQIEATVTACDISYRPRRQLVVTVDDGSDTYAAVFQLLPVPTKSPGGG